MKKLVLCGWSIVLALSASMMAEPEKALPVPEALIGFADYVTAGLTKSGIPGLAIAIVKDTDVVFSQGFGVRKLGEPELVNDKTIFAVGSTTKAFTAGLLAMLVAEGKLSWDDPVEKFLPGFALADTLATRELTIRDLLTHRSGLPDHGGDLLFFGYAYDRHEIIRRMRFLKPDSGFRSRYAYQNLMYMVAGEVVAAVRRKPWESVIEEQFFIPLAMDDTTTNVRSVEGAENVAIPHAVIEGKVTPIRYRPIDSAGGAGVINSTVRDMSIWLRVMLGEGKFDGKTFWKAAQAREMFAAQTVLPLEGPRIKSYPDAHFVCYGLGWFLSDYHGRKLAQHSGNVDGMSAHVLLVPEEKLGIVLLANKDYALSLRGLALEVVDRYLKLPKKDRFAEMIALETELRDDQKSKEQATLDKQVKDTKPTYDLERYAGFYRSPLYGDAVVEWLDDKLIFRLGVMHGELSHFHYDTFLLTWKNPQDGRALVRFVPNDLGKIGGLRLVELHKPNDSDAEYLRIERQR